MSFADLCNKAKKICFENMSLTIETLFFSWKIGSVLKSMPLLSVRPYGTSLTITQHNKHAYEICGWRKSETTHTINYLCYLNVVLVFH